MHSSPSTSARVWTILACTFIFLTTTAFTTLSLEREATAQTRRKKRKKRTKKAYRPYKKGWYTALSIFSPGGCFNTNTACPEGTRFSSENFKSADVSFGYRFGMASVGMRILGNAFEVPNPTPSAAQEGDDSVAFGGGFLHTRIFFVPSSKKRFDPYLNLGIGAFGAQSFYNNRENEVGLFGLNLGAGADYHLVRGFALGLSYDTFLTQDNQDNAAFWALRFNLTAYWSAFTSSSSSRSRRRRPSSQPTPKRSNPRKKTY